MEGAKAVSGTSGSSTPSPMEQTILMAEGRELRVEEGGDPGATQCSFTMAPRPRATCTDPT
jgi:hypothetical protein